MAPAPRIVVIVNARARHVARSPGLADRLRRIVGERGSVVVTQDAEDVPGALAEAGPLQECVVALCGGDGAGMFGLSALRALGGEATMPRVSLLPAGTVNTVARSLGVRGGPEAALRSLVRRLDAGLPLRTHAHATLAANEQVGFIFGAGLVSSFFALYNDNAAAGRLWAAAQIGRIFVGSFVGASFARRIMAPVPARLTVDGVPHPLDRVTLLLASTLVDVGLGLKVTYRAAESTGGFHIVGTDLPAGRLGPQLPRVLLGRPLQAARLLDAVAHEVVLELPPGASYLLDGELFRAESIRLRPGPRVLLVW